MSKLKVVLLVILAVVLVVFALENTQPCPVLRFFKYALGSLPTFLLVYLSLAVGLVVGWLAHVFRIRRKRREAAASPMVSAQKEQKAQQSYHGGQAAQ